MDWFLSAFTVATNFVIGRKSYWGWLMMFIGGLIWIYYSISIKQYGLIPASVFNIGVSVISFRKWYREAKEAEKWFYSELDKIKEQGIIK